MTSMKGVKCSEEWYLDSGCSTHMIGRNDWFVKINCTMKKKVKFADDTTLMTDDIDDVLIMRRDDGHSLIKDVLYISGIKCNLISIDQLLEKDYKIHMKNKGLRLLDANGALVLKAPMIVNIIFKVELNVMDIDVLLLHQVEKIGCGNIVLDISILEISRICKRTEW